MQADDLQGDWSLGGNNSCRRTTAEFRCRPICSGWMAEDHLNDSPPTRLKMTKMKRRDSRVARSPALASLGWLRPLHRHAGHKSCDWRVHAWTDGAR